MVDLRMRLGFWVESGLALVSTVLALVTVVRRDWIELVFGVDPDQHSGSVEWALIFAALAVAVTSVTLASRELRRRRVVA